MVSSSGAEVDVALEPDLHYSEVVSVGVRPKDPFEAYQPTSVLSGQDLTVKTEASLGELLKTEPGVSQRSLGPAPSRPVIRGLDGDRVLILENGQRTDDLSSQSADHGVSVNPLAATRVEVVRGPATLLYGANAIGGLVNVVSEVIPTMPSTSRARRQFELGRRHAADDASIAADYGVGNGRWALHLGGTARRVGRRVDAARPRRQHPVAQHAVRVRRLVDAGEGLRRPELPVRRLGLRHPGGRGRRHQPSRRGGIPSAPGRRRGR